MPIKAIFFDIDGTLISFKTHSVPKSTLSALDKLRAKGIKLFIATGRLPQDLDFLLKDLHHYFDAYITLTGQYCFDKGHNIIHDQAIEQQDLRNLINILQKKEFACGIMELDYYYLNLVNKRILDLQKILGDTAPDRPIDAVERALTHKTYQLNFFLDEPQVQEILKQMPNCKSVRWCPYFADIIPKTGGKPEGIKHILDYYHIKLSETMAFGDGGNDKDMLAFVGTGIAMGNGNDEAKAAADYITDTVDDDGILKALKHFNLL